MIKISAKQFIELCEDENLSVLPEYSGRAMYGRNCVAVTGHGSDLMRFTMVVLPQLTALEGGPPNDGDLICITCGNRVDPPVICAEWFTIAQDNFGLDMVYYWPDVQVVNDLDGDPDARD